MSTGPSAREGRRAPGAVNPGPRGRRPRGSGRLVRARLRAAAVLVVCALVLTTVWAGALLAAAHRYLAAPVGDRGVLTLLLLGADEGPHRAGSPLSARADAFHLLFVSPDRQHATFVNVPRDAFVSVPGRGRTKINACLVGGPRACAATVARVFGVQVDHWFVTDFRGLAVAVDRFGGVTLEVPQRLTDGGADIEPGRQRLRGAQALAFARDRKHRPGGDFRRSAEQARFLQAAHAQLFSRGPSVGRIAETVGILQQTTVSSARPVELLQLGYLALTIPPRNVHSVTLSGRGGTAGGGSVVFLSARAHSLVADVAADGVLGGRRSG